MAKRSRPGEDGEDGDGGRKRAQSKRTALLDMDPAERHRKLIKDYVKYHRNVDKPGTSKAVKTDYDVLKETYRFVRSEDDDDELQAWECQLAKKYYDRLYKEYCIADLKYSDQGKVGLRWRTEKEVMVGRGQFTCGARKCSGEEGLTSFEVNFAYAEDGERKNALVKVRLCPTCAPKLHCKIAKDSKAEEQKHADAKSSEQDGDLLDGILQ